MLIMAEKFKKNSRHPVGIFHCFEGLRQRNYLNIPAVTKHLVWLVICPSMPNDIYIFMHSVLYHVFIRLFVHNVLSPIIGDATCSAQRRTYLKQWGMAPKSSTNHLPWTSWELRNIGPYSNNTHFWLSVNDALCRYYTVVCKHQVIWGDRMHRNTIALTIDNNILLFCLYPIMIIYWRAFARLA